MLRVSPSRCLKEPRSSLVLMCTIWIPDITVLLDILLFLYSAKLYCDWRPLISVHEVEMAEALLLLTHQCVESSSTEIVVSINSKSPPLMIGIVAAPMRAMISKMEASTFSAKIIRSARLSFGYHLDHRPIQY